MQAAIEIIGSAQTKRNRDRLILAAETVEAVAFPLVVEDFYRVESDRFRREGGATMRARADAKWAPLAASTVAGRERRGLPGAHPILHADGDLEESLATGDHENSVVRVEPGSVFVGTKDPKAAWHKRGTDRMPARDPVVIDDVTGYRWCRFVQKALMQGVVHWLWRRRSRWPTSTRPR